MSFVVKAQSTSDINKPPDYWTINETEIVSQNRSARSQQPEEHYHLSPKIKSADDTLPLDETRIQSAQQLLKSPRQKLPSASSSDTFPSSGSDDFLRKINLEWTKSADSVFGDSPFDNKTRGIKTAESFDLGRLTGAYSHLEAVYVDSKPACTTTVSTTILSSEPTSTVSIASTVAPAIIAPLAVAVPSAPTVDIINAPTTSSPVTAATYSVPYAGSVHSVPGASATGQIVTVGTAPAAVNLSPPAPADHSADEDDNVTDSTSSESDTEPDMADINPPKFSGTAIENAEMWMRHFNNFCAFKEHNDNKARTLFQVLMVGSAATWLDSIDDATRNDWGALKDAFLARYTTPEFLNYKNAQLLFNCKQDDRSVDDYCAHMQRIAKQIGADDRMLRFSVLNGLRGDIANYVIQKQPTDWKQLLEAARVGEMCTTAKPQTDTVVTAQLTLMQDQLHQLTTRLDTPR